MRPLILFAALTIVLLACDGGWEPGVTARLTVQPSELELQVADSGTIAVSVTGVIDPRFLWESSNEQVAVVASDPEPATVAIVRAIGPGEARIHVSVEGTSLTGTTRVVVLP